MSAQHQNARTKKISRVANSVRVSDRDGDGEEDGVWYKNKIYFSYDACNNVEIQDEERPSPTGNEKLLVGFKITQDDLLYNNTEESSDELTKIWFYLDTPEDCQFECEQRRGVCGAWSFDFSTQTCYLHSVDACCGQFGKREESQDYISGYTCSVCWTTKNECPDSMCPLKNRQYDGQTAFGAGGQRPTHATGTGALVVSEVNNPNKNDPCKCKWVKRKRRRGYRCLKPRECNEK